MSNLKNTKKPTTPSYVRKSITRYQKQSVKRIVIILYHDTDGAIIETVELLKNMSGYIKSLVADDIKENPKYEPNPVQAPVARRYNKSEKRRVNVLVNITGEADILERISAHKNIGGYIKLLVNKDISVSEVHKKTPCTRESYLLRKGPPKWATWVNLTVLRYEPAW